MSRDALVDEAEQVARRVGRFLATVGDSVDDIEIWLERTERRGYTFRSARLVPFGHADERVGIRVMKDGRLGAASTSCLDEDAWRRCATTALALASPAEITKEFATARARRPAPVTFDPDLAEAVAPPGALRRIAHAMIDNTLHEAERMPGLRALRGGLAYGVRRRVVGTRGGVVVSLHGDLDGRIELNDAFGEAFHQVHAPESFQPLALLGARTWRTMPRELAGPDALGAKGRIPVVLHPRALETLLRTVVVPRLTLSARREGRLPFVEGDVIVDPGITLVDDCGLDGLATSRPFDDEGVPARRTPLVVRGRLSQLLGTRFESLREGEIPTASAWRRGDVPEEAPPRASAGSLLMERGDTGFHEMLGALDRGLLVHRFAGLDDADGPFTALVPSGLTLERGRESRLLAPDQWRVSGRALAPGDPADLLAKVVLSRELYDTGSAILPYCLTWLEVL
jgi:predicted Zn-dependent protease